MEKHRCMNLKYDMSEIDSIVIKVDLRQNSNAFLFFYPKFHEKYPMRISFFDRICENTKSIN